MIKSIIFDFDGVILNSVNLKTEAFYQVFKKYGDNIANKIVEYHVENGGLSRFKKIKYINKYYLNNSLTENDINMIANNFSNLVFKKILSVDFINGARLFLENNYKKYNFYISTGTPQEEIERVIIDRTLNKFFKKIYGSPKTKLFHINDIIKKEKLIKEEVIFIGDSINDFDAAINANINFLGIGNNIKFSENKIITIPDLTYLEEYLNSQ